MPRHTALIEATKGGHMNVVKELIQSGVDVDEQDQFGSTALTVSAAYNDKRIIKLLLKKGRPFTAPESMAYT